MKKLVEVVEVENEGLMALMGEHVVLWCDGYIYAGVLKGVNKEDVLLHEAKVVYETGPLMQPGFKDAQELPGPWYVRVGKIESYGKMK